MQARRKLFVVERQTGFDQAGNTSSYVQVPQVGFDRTYRTASVFGSSGSKKSLGESRNLNGIAYGSACTMGLNVTQGISSHIGQRQCLADDFSLAVDARRSIAHFLFPSLLIAAPLITA